MSKSKKALIALAHNVREAVLKEEQPDIDTEKEINGLPFVFMANIKMWIPGYVTSEYFQTIMPKFIDAFTSMPDAHAEDVPMYAECLLVDDKELHIIPSIYSRPLFERKIQSIMEYYFNAIKLLEALQKKTDCSTADKQLENTLHLTLTAGVYDWIRSSYPMRLFVPVIYQCPYTVHLFRRLVQAALPELTQAPQ
jgi:hypothetical protein